MGVKVRGLWKKGNIFYHRKYVHGVTTYTKLVAATEGEAILEIVKLQQQPGLHVSNRGGRLY